MDTDQLYIPNPNYNPASKKIAIELCEQILSKQKVPTSLPYKIRSMLIKSIEDSPTMAQIAEKLGMTERTLRRKRVNSGISFQAISDDIRKEIAIEQLQTTDMPIKDIAYLIGMRDAGNFSRNFKRWTGKSPSHYRVMR